jgi:hypothetical protein
MESYLLQLRTTLDFIDDDVPFRYIIASDYVYLYNIKDINDVENLIDVLKVTQDKKETLLLYVINIALIYYKTSILYTIEELVIKYEIKTLQEKFNTHDILLNLYEIVIYPTVLRFLLVTKVDTSLDDMIKHKSKTVFLNNYWNFIDINFYAACQIETMEINKHCTVILHNEKYIHYWLYCLMCYDQVISEYSIGSFINDENFYHSTKSYHDLKQLALSKTYNIKMKRVRYIAPKPIKVIVPKPININTCYLCQTKQPCLHMGCSRTYGSEQFKVCHYQKMAFHGCEIHANALDKETRRDTDKQTLMIRVTDNIKHIFPDKDMVTLNGYRLNNVLVYFKNNIIDTRDVFCKSPEFPSLDGIKSVSLRVFVYDDLYYTLGTIDDMTVCCGYVSEDIVVMEDASINTTEKNKYIEAMCNGKKIKFDLSQTYIIIDDVMTEHKSTSIRIFNAWKTDEGNRQFQGPLKKQYYYIFVGILNHTVKYKVYDIL